MTKSDTKTYNKNSRSLWGNGNLKYQKGADMYSENNRRSARLRADDEFLRRMTGGDLIGNGCPTVPMNEAPSPTPMCDIRPRLSCNGNNNSVSHDCPNTVGAPSLAMVYSPKQCWRSILSPKEGLTAGTIFTELVLPLEVNLKNRTKEACPRRCF